jgi:hypothetical protein
LYTTDVLSVLGANGLAGDLNQSGAVDAGDYVAWRNAGGSAAAYSLWRANFGRTTGGSAVEVPEPELAPLFELVLAGLAAAQHSRQSRHDRFI